MRRRSQWNIRKLMNVLMKLKTGFMTWKTCKNSACETQILCLIEMRSSM